MQDDVKALVKKLMGQRDEIDRVIKALAPIYAVQTEQKPARKKRRRMSAKGRARVAEGQRARWAKLKAAKAAPAIEREVEAVAV